MVLKYLLEKEFKQIRRNIIMPALIVVYVLMVLFLFPWAVNFEAKDIHVTILDEDHTTLSRQLVEKVSHTPSFVLVRVTSTYQEAYTDIETKASGMLLRIPPHFAKDLLTDRHPVVDVVANAVDGSQASLGSAYLHSILEDFSDEVRIRMIGKGKEDLSPLRILPLYLFNPTLDYKSFMLPAFIVMILTMICGIIPAMNIILEKEVGTMQQINVTPISRTVFILGKIIPFWIIGLAIYALSIVILWLLYGVVPAGSLLTLTLAGLIYIISISGMGVLISNFSSTLQQGMFLILFFILILFLLSGLFTPVSAMPWWAKVIAYLNPLTYFIEIMRMIYLKGATLSDLYLKLLILLGFGVVLNVFSVVTHKKRQ